MVSLKVRYRHPILWLPLALPIGISTGFISVILSNALGRAAVEESSISNVVATFFLATSFGVLWGPLIDSLWSRRLWTVVGTAVTGGGLACMTLLPITTANLLPLIILSFVSGSGAIMVGLASKGYAAHLLPMEKRTLAGAWYAAGNLGSAAAAGAVGVLLFAGPYPRPLLAAIVALSVSSTFIAIALLPPDAHHPVRGIGVRIRQPFADVWAMLRGAKGSVAALLCVVPFGTGAAILLMPSVAPQWRTDPQAVSFASALSAPISAIAALAGGWIALRLNAWRAFFILGVLLIVTAAAATPLPHTAPYFVAVYSVYACLQGAIWSSFYAVVFDTAREGSASTKMGVYLSLANIPYWYMTLIQGRAIERWGISGLLLSDAALSTLGLIALLILARVVRLPTWRPKH